MRGLIWIGASILGVVMVLSMVTFTVDETNQAVVVRMGEPVRVVKEPGLHFKLPFPVETVHKFDRRLLEYDSAPAQIYTKDKKNLIVDNYARWRIVDPLAFLKTVRTEAGALSRLDDIVYAVLREELGRHTLSEVVAKNRELIMRTVTQKCDAATEKLGIEVVDVRIKRADLPKENERYVFDRMRAERHKMANQYRSEGEEMALKIRAQTDLEKRRILAEAYRKAEEIKGEGDAEASRIYAEAYKKDPEFYAFIRSLQAYDAVMDSSTVLVLPPEGPFLRYLRR
ncbi:MAG: protease modulator HflC [Candidatus Latescibacterota bacterium]|nr:MAG: protease modulator HflC [Candidatus Latescibacterota bacterium]